MDKHQYFTELQAALINLPSKEAVKAVDYYKEYFSDALDSGQSEFQIIMALGTPQSVAAQIMAESKIRYERREQVFELASHKPTPQNLFKTVALTLGAPIALPLMIVMYILAFALFVTGFALVAAFGAVAVAGMTAGTAGLVVSVPSGFYFGSWFLSLELICAGLILLGLGFIFLYLVKGVSKITLKISIGIFVGLGRIFYRRSNRQNA